MLRKNQTKAWSRPLADLIGATMHPLLAKRGFSEAGLILNWDEIVGARIAKACEPIKLQFPPRGTNPMPDAAPQPATLVLQVEGAFALELQHLTPIVIQRVNTHFGWACIGRVSLRQGPLQRRPILARVPLEPRPASIARAAEITRDIEDAPLRHALQRLGARVFEDKPR